jgi:adenylate cyclase
LTYRKKILLTFVIVALVTNVVSMAVMYRLSHHYLFAGYQAKILSISATVATMLDGDELKTIRTAADANTPAYRRLKETLRRAREANHRPDTHMKRMFTVLRSEKDPSVVLIGVDSAEGLRDSSQPGEVYRTLNAGPLDISKLTVEDRFTTDEFGTFLRTWAPVRDSRGEIVGAVVVAAESRWVAQRMEPLIYSGLGSLVLSALMGALAAFAISRRASRPLERLHRAVDTIGKGDFSARVPVEGRDEFAAVAQAVNTMAEGLGERDRVKSAFARYVSQQVMDSVLSRGASALQLSGDRRRISVLFCDIRGFSTMSERMPPEKVVAVLNEYFECMVEVVFRNHGTLDKFIGDGMMVIFGAPEDDPCQEEHALQTAIEMQRELEMLRRKWQPEGVDIRIGVGINSGPAVVGNIGSSRRMDYTAIGDTVNLASRLESATKDLGVGILVSEYTYNALRGMFAFRSMGEVTVRGRREPVQTYSVEATAAAAPEPVGAARA